MEFLCSYSSTPLTTAILPLFKCNRTYTGLQTLGGETVCEVELDRATIGLAVDRLLKQPVLNTSDIKKEFIGQFVV